MLRPSNPGDDTLSAQVTLTDLVPEGNVSIQAYVIGSPGVTITNVIHHLRVYVNQSPYDAGDAIFATNGYYVATFSIPASQFVSGTNTLRFVEVGDLSQGDYDILSIQEFRSPTLMPGQPMPLSVPDLLMPVIWKTIRPSPLPALPALTWSALMSQTTAMQVF